MVNIKNSIRSYFGDRTNIIVFGILAIAVVYAIFVRSINMGVLAYWGDDGQTILGTLGVVEHGFPRLPSGNVMYNAFFSFYLEAIPVLLMGLNEVALRLPNVILGVLTVPLVFLFVKDLSNKYTALAASVIVSLNIWQIEYSREIRYYQEFQFLYLLSVYLFYLGFFKGRRNCKIASVVFIFITILTNHIGVTLLFLFVPLLVYKRFKGFFKKETLIYFFIILVIVVGSILHRVFFWKAGLSFYDANIDTAITNPLLRILSKFFAPYAPFYSRIFSVLFPTMFYVVFYGWPLILLHTFIPWIRSGDEDLIDIYSPKRSNYSIKFPFNLFFLYFLFFSNTVFNGFGYMNTQQRYIFHANIFFIAIFCYIVFDIARLFAAGIIALFKNRKTLKTIESGASGLSGNPGTAADLAGPGRQSAKLTAAKTAIFLASAVLILIFTVNWANPVSNFKIVFRKNGDPVDGRFSVSNTFDFHHDPKTAGQYIAQHKQEGDLVIATDLLNPYGYTRQIDYWLWTSTTFYTWQPFFYKDWGVFEEFYNVPVIRDYYQLLEVLNDNADKNIWLITSNSIRVPGHISKTVADFILAQEQFLKVTGQDGICSAYLFPKLDGTTRGYNIPIEEKNIIEFPQNIGVDKPQKVFPFSFSNKKNSDYLFYGWSDIEPHGTWINNNNALLFINLAKKADYVMDMEFQALYSPEQPQEMKIFFNDIEVGYVKFSSSDPVTYSIKIDRDLVDTDNYNIIKFKSKYLLTPKDLGVSDDARFLTVYFKKLLFTPQ